MNYKINKTILRLNLPKIYKNDNELHFKNMNKLNFLRVKFF